jgi:hypothetical protein
MYAVGFSYSSWAMSPASVAGKTLYYKGETGTDSRIELKITPNGNSYKATIFSGKYRYNCFSAPLLPDGMLDITECGEIDLSDPNAGTEPLSTYGSYTLIVEGSLDLVIGGYDGGIGRGTRIEFTLDRERTFKTRQRANPEPDGLRVIEAEIRRKQLALKMKELEAKEKALAIAQERDAAIAAERKRKAQLERKKQAAIAAERKRKAQLERKKQAATAAERKRRETLERKKQAAIAAERKRKAQLEKKKREAFFQSKPYAKQLLSDIKSFVRRNPGVLDPLTIATLYTPTMQEISSGKFKNAGSKFSKLSKFVKQNGRFSTYHSSRMKDRAKRLEAKRKTLRNKIKKTITRVKNRIVADPFSSNAMALTEILKRYQKTPKNMSLSQLQRRIKTLSSKLKGLGVAVGPPSKSASPKPVKTASKRKKKPKRQTLKALSDLANNDVVLLANLGAEAKHTFRDLRGFPAFDKRTVWLCAPALFGENKKYQYYLRNRLNKTLRSHKFRITKRCARGFRNIDAIFASGKDFAKGDTLPAFLEIKKKVQDNNLIRMLKVKKSDFERYLLKRGILSSQYKSDIISGARQGFGGLSLKGNSEIGCVVGADEEIHEKFLVKVRAAHEFNSGVTAKGVVQLNTKEAFKQAQRKNCGFIYANASNLRLLTNAAKRANLSLNVLPVWISPNQVVQSEKELVARKNNLARAKRERLADLNRKQIENQKAAAAKVAKLSERQRRYRETYGAKVASLVAGINRNVLSGKSYWDNLNTWRTNLEAKGWQFGSTVPRSVDYGFAKWRGRKIETILAEIKFSMKHPDLGEYKQSCWMLGYLNDTEFNRIRDLISVPCAKLVEVAKWSAANAFDTRWLLVK